MLVVGGMHKHTPIYRRIPTLTIQAFVRISFLCFYVMLLLKARGRAAKDVRRKSAALYSALLLLDLSRPLIEIDTLESLYWRTRCLFFYLETEYGFIENVKILHRAKTRENKYIDELQLNLETYKNGVSSLFWSSQDIYYIDEINYQVEGVYICLLEVHKCGTA